MDIEIVCKRRIDWNSLEEEQQQRIFKTSQNPRFASLILSEPKPTFTFGRRANRNDLLWNLEMCTSKGVEIKSVKRGGHWTYHGPGQLLIYPILQLQQLNYPSVGVRAFLEDFRAVIQYSLKEVGANVIAQQNPFGIYDLTGAKIVSFGVHINKGILSHGAAIYLTRQTEFFNGINPCGVTGGRVSSLQEHGLNITWDNLASLIGKSLLSKWNVFPIESPIY